MFVKLSISLILSLVVLASGCSSKSADSQSLAQSNAPQTASTAPSNTPAVSPAVNPTVNGQSKADLGASPASGPASPNACALIETSEIESVQGGRVQGTVPSRRDGNGLAISQCFYTVFSSDGSKNLSVHLETMQDDPKSSEQNAVGNLWKKFSEAKGSKKTERPKLVSGIGDEAYWVGNEKAGALYALKSGKIVRVSVGGADSPQAKIEKSKTLVAKVLQRLS